MRAPRTRSPAASTAAASPSTTFRPSVSCPASPQELALRLLRRRRVTYQPKLPQTMMIDRLNARRKDRRAHAIASGQAATSVSLGSWRVAAASIVYLRVCRHKQSIARSPLINCRASRYDEKLLTGRPSRRTRRSPRSFAMKDSRNVTTLATMVPSQLRGAVGVSRDIPWSIISPTKVTATRNSTLKSEHCECSARCSRRSMSRAATSSAISWAYQPAAIAVTDDSRQPVRHARNWTSGSFSKRG
jgi:hypothetical protein